MRLTCPNCATDYEVPDAALAGRSRKLRCQICATEWRAGEELPAVVAPNIPPSRWTVPVLTTPAAPARPQSVGQPQFDAPPGSYARVPVEWADSPQAADIRQFSQTFEAQAAPAPPDELELGPERSLPADSAPAFSQSQSSLPAGSLPSFLSGDAAPPIIPAGERPDRFAELVHAARSKSIEFEPEFVAPRKSNRTPLLLLLLLAVAILFLLLDHHQIETFIPGMVPFYRGLGLQ